MNVDVSQNKQLSKKCSLSQELTNNQCHVAGYLSGAAGSLTKEFS